jgi:hypothetical protein
MTDGARALEVEAGMLEETGTAFQTLSTNTTPQKGTAKIFSEYRFNASFPIYYHSTINHMIIV